MNSFQISIACHDTQFSESSLHAWEHSNRKHFTGSFSLSPFLPPHPSSVPKNQHLFSPPPPLPTTFCCYRETKRILTLILSFHFSSWRILAAFGRSWYFRARTLNISCAADHDLVEKQPNKALYHTIIWAVFEEKSYKLFHRSSSPPGNFCWGKGGSACILSSCAIPEHLLALTAFGPTRSQGMVSVSLPSFDRYGASKMFLQQLFQLGPTQGYQIKTGNKSCYLPFNMKNRKEIYYLTPVGWFSYFQFTFLTLCLLFYNVLHHPF